MKDYYFVPLGRLSPKLLDPQLGIEEGFIDAAELIDPSVPDEIKVVSRMKLKVAPGLDGFPYFCGYRLGHELFALYASTASKKEGPAVG